MAQVTLSAEVQPQHMGQRLDQTLAELFPDYSRSRLKTWIEDNLVKVNGEIINVARTKVYGGESVGKLRTRADLSLKIYHSILFMKMSIF
ncbi:23S rRNA pseudouridine synthase D [Canicola haemoglobinophilus]|uniref:Ribosomal large subunit pseudouridine synthase D n=1 Tax=Canicola haemoglobinophilus TaxID=733 RepID=A0A377HV47_9PAST|nr:23S rRNA pseudouridine synthase D [Canicola haemoglobinophilus]